MTSRTMDLDALAIRATSEYTETSRSVRDSFYRFQVLKYAGFYFHELDAARQWLLLLLGQDKPTSRSA